MMASRHQFGLSVVEIWVIGWSGRMHDVEF
jgi:hypothetical protein